MIILNYASTKNLGFWLDFMQQEAVISTTSRKG